MSLRGANEMCEFNNTPPSTAHSARPPPSSQKTSGRGSLHVAFPSTVPPSSCTANLLPPSMERSRTTPVSQRSGRDDVHAILSPPQTPINSARRGSAAVPGGAFANIFDLPISKHQPVGVSSAPISPSHGGGSAYGLPSIVSVESQAQQPSPQRDAGAGAGGQESGTSPVTPSTVHNVHFGLSTGGMTISHGGPADSTSRPASHATKVLRSGSITHEMFSSRCERTPQTPALAGRISPLRRGLSVSTDSGRNILSISSEAQQRGASTGTAPPESLTSPVFDVRHQLTTRLAEAVQLARHLRSSGGVFAFSHQRDAMLLYDLMGLEDDAYTVPPNQLQCRLQRYQFPPPEMEKLAAMPTADRDTVVAMIGVDEMRRRRRHTRRWQRRLERGRPETPPPYSPRPSTSTGGYGRPSGGQATDGEIDSDSPLPSGRPRGGLHILLRDEQVVCHRRRVLALADLSDHSSDKDEDSVDDEVSD